MFNPALTVSNYFLSQPPRLLQSCPRGLFHEAFSFSLEDMAGKFVIYVVTIRNTGFFVFFKYERILISPRANRPIRESRTRNDCLLFCYPYKSS